MSIFSYSVDFRFVSGIGIPVLGNGNNMSNIQHVYSGNEAVEFFLKEHDKDVIAVNSKGGEKRCSSYPEALEHIQKKFCVKCDLELPPGHRKKWCVGKNQVCECDRKLNKWREENNIV